jgi:hypothetical protein
MPVKGLNLIPILDDRTSINDENLLYVEIDEDKSLAIFVFVNDERYEVSLDELSDNTRSDLGLPPRD